MLKRLKSALVESFVGAIALGWIFSQGITNFASVFVAPISGWVQRRQFRGMPGMPLDTGFTLRDSVPALARSVALLLLGYALLRWLYYKPVEPEAVPESSSMDMPETGETLKP